jgi:hypothetical protein
MLGLARPGPRWRTLAGDGDDVLGARGFGLGVGERGGFFVEDDLGDAGAVAEVEEDEVAVVAAAVDPAHEGNGLAGIGGAQVAAHLGALQGAKEVESHNLLLYEVAS